MAVEAPPAVVASMALVFPPAPVMINVEMVVAAKVIGPAVNAESGVPAPDFGPFSALGP